MLAKESSDMEAVLLMIKARRWEQGEGDAQEPGDALITLWTWEEYKRQGHCMCILQSIFHVLNKEYDSSDILMDLSTSPSMV